MFIPPDISVCVSRGLEAKLIRTWCSSLSLTTFRLRRRQVSCQMPLHGGKQRGLTQKSDEMLCEPAQSAPPYSRAWWSTQRTLRPTNCWKRARTNLHKRRTSQPSSPYGRAKNPHQSAELVQPRGKQILVGQSSIQVHESISSAKLKITAGKYRWYASTTVAFPWSWTRSFGR